jgi:hypothetical protein
VTKPLTRTERQAERQRIRRRCIAKAEAEALVIGRSLVCQVGAHSPSCVGAAGCICECHDPELGA